MGIQVYRGSHRVPWWVEAETDSDMITIASTSKNRFVGTEWERDLLCEKITQKLREGGYFGKIAFHCWPLAWAELRN